MNKKAESSLNALWISFIVITSIGIFAAIFLYANSQIGDNFKTSTSGSVINESGFINATTYTLTKSGLLDYLTTSITLRNATSGQVIQSGNYTITNNVIRNATIVKYDRVNITYNYTHSIADDAYNATRTVNGYVVGFIPWLGIILLVLGASVVLYFVIKSFSDGNKGP